MSIRLYELPRNTKFTLNGESFLFHHVDGMYSYCTLLDGEGEELPAQVHHFAAWTEVEVV